MALLLYLKTKHKYNIEHTIVYTKELFTVANRSLRMRSATIYIYILFHCCGDVPSATAYLCLFNKTQSTKEIRGFTALKKLKFSINALVCRLSLKTVLQGGSVMTCRTCYYGLYHLPLCCTYTAV